MTIAGTNTSSSNSPRPPAQSAIQPQQGQSQPQAQAPQTRPSIPQQAKGSGSLPQADSVELLTKLKKVETHIAELRNKQIEAGRAGRTDEANKLAVLLTRDLDGYKRVCEFMVKILDAKRTTAVAQGAQQQLLMQVIRAYAQAQVQDTTQTPQMQQAAQAQVQAGGRVAGGYPMHAWQQPQMSMNETNGVAFHQGGGQPHANLAAAQAKTAQAHAHAQAQSQAGAR